MSGSISPFLVPEGWTIDCWDPRPENRDTGLPLDGFQKKSTMFIGIEPSSGSFSLQWLNQLQEVGSMSGLEPDPLIDPAAFQLAGQNLDVSFGGGVHIACDVKLRLSSMDPKTLCGSIHVADGGLPTTPAGTFTATANAGGNSGVQKL